MPHHLSDTRPAPAPRATRAPLYPFHLLTAAGLSITFPFDVNSRRLTAAAHAYAKRHGWVAAVRRLPNGEFCVWRLRDLESHAPRAVAPETLRAGASVPYVVADGNLVSEARVQRQEAAHARKREAREQDKINKLRVRVAEWLIDRYTAVSIDTLAEAVNVTPAGIEQVLDFWREHQRIVDTPEGVRWTRKPA